MAENSPSKRTRTSPQAFHPYDRTGGTGRSPLQGLKGLNHPNIPHQPRQVKPLADLDFDRRGQGLGYHPNQAIVKPPFGIIGEHRKIKPKADATASSSTATTATVAGASIGFIPVDQSCTIGGGSCDTEIIRFEQEVKPKKFFKNDNPWRNYKSHHGYLPPQPHLSSVNVGAGARPSSTFSIYVEKPPVTSDEPKVQQGFNSSFKENYEDLENVGGTSSSGLPNVHCDVTSGVIGQLQPKGLNSSFTEKFVSRLGLHSGPETVTQEEGQQTDVKTQLGRRGILMEKFIPIFDYPEYLIDILKYWGRVERRIRPKLRYMERQKEISHKMRSILIDWIMEVVSEYDMTEQTLHLTVNYLDRFLSKMKCLRTKLQLIGTTALVIASKFEEVQPPELSDFVFVTDEAYTKTHILDMERVMLNVLEFDLMVPTAHDFATAYCSTLKVGSPIRCLAMYLVDLSLMDGERFTDYLPSLIATAAVVIGRYSFEHVYWDDRIRKLTAHRQKTVTACVKHLVEAFFNAPEMAQTTIYEKYLSVKYCAISQAFIPSQGPWSDEWNE